MGSRYKLRNRTDQEDNGDGCERPPVQVSNEGAGPSHRAFRGRRGFQSSRTPHLPHGGGRQTLQGPPRFTHEPMLPWNRRGRSAGQAGIEGPRSLEPQGLLGHGPPTNFGPGPPLNLPPGHFESGASMNLNVGSDAIMGRGDPMNIGPESRMFLSPGGEPMGMGPSTEGFMPMGPRAHGSVIPPLMSLGASPGNAGMPSERFFDPPGPPIHGPHNMPLLRTGELQLSHGPPLPGEPMPPGLANLPIMNPAAICTDPIDDPSLNASGVAIPIPIPIPNNPPPNWPSDLTTKKRTVSEKRSSTRLLSKQPQKLVACPPEPPKETSPSISPTPFVTYSDAPPLPLQSPMQKEADASTGTSEVVNDSQERYSPSKQDTDEEVDALVIRPKVWAKGQAKKRLLAFSISKMTPSTSTALKKLKKSAKDKPSQFTKAPHQLQATVDAIEKEKRRFHNETVGRLENFTNLQEMKLEANKKQSPFRRSRKKSDSGSGERTRSESYGRNESKSTITEEPKQHSDEKALSRSGSKEEGKRLRDSKGRSRSRSNDEERKQMSDEEKQKSGRKARSASRSKGEGKPQTDDKTRSRSRSNEGGKLQNERVLRSSRGSMDGGKRQSGGKTGSRSKEKDVRLCEGKQRSASRDKRRTSSPEKRRDRGRSPSPGRKRDRGPERDSSDGRKNKRENIGSSSEEAAAIVADMPDWKSVKNAGIVMNEEFLRPKLRLQKSRADSDVRPIFSYYTAPKRFMSSVPVKPVAPRQPMKFYTEKALRFTETRPILLWSQKPLLDDDSYFMPRSIMLANTDKINAELFLHIAEARDVKSRFTEDDSLTQREWYPKEEYLISAFNDDDVLKEECTDKSIPKESERGDVEEETKPRKIGLVEYASGEESPAEQPLEVQVEADGNVFKVKSKWDSDNEENTIECDKEIIEATQPHVLEPVPKEQITVDKPTAREQEKRKDKKHKLEQELAEQEQKKQSKPQADKEPYKKESDQREPKRRLRSRSDKKSPVRGESREINPKHDKKPPKEKIDQDSRRTRSKFDRKSPVRELSKETKHMLTETSHKVKSDQEFKKYRSRLDEKSPVRKASRHDEPRIKEESSKTESKSKDEHKLDKKLEAKIAEKDLKKVCKPVVEIKAELEDKKMRLQLDQDKSPRRAVKCFERTDELEDGHTKEVREPNRELSSIVKEHMPIFEDPSKIIEPKDLKEESLRLEETPNVKHQKKECKPRLEEDISETVIVYEAQKESLRFDQEFPVVVGEYEFIERQSPALKDELPKTEMENEAKIKRSRFDQTTPSEIVPDLKKTNMPISDEEVSKVLADQEHKKEKSRFESPRKVFELKKGEDKESLVDEEFHKVALKQLSMKVSPRCDVKSPAIMKEHAQKTLNEPSFDEGSSDFVAKSRDVSKEIIESSSKSEISLCRFDDVSFDAMTDEELVKGDRRTPIKGVPKEKEKKSDKKTSKKLHQIVDKNVPQKQEEKEPVIAEESLKVKSGPIFDEDLQEMVAEFELKKRNTGKAKLEREERRKLRFERELSKKLEAESRENNTARVRDESGCWDSGDESMKHKKFEAGDKFEFEKSDAVAVELSSQDVMQPTNAKVESLKPIDTETKKEWLVIPTQPFSSGYQAHGNVFKDERPQLLTAVGRAKRLSSSYEMEDPQELVSEYEQFLKLVESEASTVGREIPLPKENMPAKSAQKITDLEKTEWEHESSSQDERDKASSNAGDIVDVKLKISEPDIMISVPKDKILVEATDEVAPVISPSILIKSERTLKREKFTPGKAQTEENESSSEDSSNDSSSSSSSSVDAPKKKKKKQTKKKRKAKRRPTAKESSSGEISDSDDTSKKKKKKSSKHKSKKEKKKSLEKVRLQELNEQKKEIMRQLVALESKKSEKIIIKKLKKLEKKLQKTKKLTGLKLGKKGGKFKKVKKASSSSESSDSSDEKAKKKKRKKKPKKKDSSSSSSDEGNRHRKKNKKDKYGKAKKKKGDRKRGRGDDVELAIEAKKPRHEEPQVAKKESVPEDEGSGWEDEGDKVVNIKVVESSAAAEKSSSTINVGVQKQGGSDWEETDSKNDWDNNDDKKSMSVAAEEPKPKVLEILEVAEVRAFESVGKPINVENLTPIMASASASSELYSPTAIDSDPSKSSSEKSQDSGNTLGSNGDSSSSVLVGSPLSFAEWGVKQDSPGRKMVLADLEVSSTLPSHFKVDSQPPFETAETKLQQSKTDPKQISHDDSSLSVISYKREDFFGKDEAKTPSGVVICNDDMVCSSPGPEDKPITTDDVYDPLAPSDLSDEDKPTINVSTAPLPPSDVFIDIPLPGQHALSDILLPGEFPSGKPPIATAHIRAAPAPVPATPVISLEPAEPVSPPRPAAAAPIVPVSTGPTELLEPLKVMSPAMSPVQVVSVRGRRWDKPFIETTAVEVINPVKISMGPTTPPLPMQSVVDHVPRPPRTPSPQTPPPGPEAAASETEAPVVTPPTRVFSVKLQQKLQHKVASVFEEDSDENSTPGPRTNRTGEKLVNEDPKRSQVKAEKLDRVIVVPAESSNVVIKTSEALRAIKPDVEKEQARQERESRASNVETRHGTSVREDRERKDYREMGSTVERDRKDDRRDVRVRCDERPRERRRSRSPARRDSKKPHPSSPERRRRRSPSPRRRRLPSPRRRVLLPRPDSPKRRRSRSRSRSPRNKRLRRRSRSRSPVQQPKRRSRSRSPMQQPLKRSRSRSPMLQPMRRSRSRSPMQQPKRRSRSRSPVKRPCESPPPLPRRRSPLSPPPHPRSPENNPIPVIGQPPMPLQLQRRSDRDSYEKPPDTPQRLSLDQRIELELGVKLHDTPPPTSQHTDTPPPVYSSFTRPPPSMFPGQPPPMNPDQLGMHPGLLMHPGQPPLQILMHPDQPPMHHGQILMRPDHPMNTGLIHMHPAMSMPPGPPMQWGPPVPTQVQHLQPPQPPQGAVVQVGNIMEVVPSIHPPPPPPPPPLPKSHHQQIVQVGNVLQVVPSARATAVVAPTLAPQEHPIISPADALQNPLIKAIQAEREKRKKEKEARREEREVRRRARQAKRDSKLMTIAEKLKNSVRNEGLMLGQDTEDEELLMEAMEPPSPPGPVEVVVESRDLPPAGKGILVAPGLLKQKNGGEKKGVSFADGFLPGEASTSGGEDRKTPPPKPKVIKEKRLKKKLKRKVKVHIIRQVVQSDEEEDDQPPPPPPPGDPPPILYATFPFGGQVQYPVYQTSVTTTTVTTVQFPKPPFQ